MTKNNYINTRTAFIIAAIFEAILAIPIAGWLFAASTGFTILFATFAIHVIAMILCARIDIPTHAPIIGVIASILGWVPLLGWFLHVIAFLFYIVTLMGIHNPQGTNATQSKNADNIKDAEIL